MFLVDRFDIFGALIIGIAFLFGFFECFFDAFRCIGYGFAVEHVFGHLGTFDDEDFRSLDRFFVGGIVGVFGNDFGILNHIRQSVCKIELDFILRRFIGI